MRSLRAFSIVVVVLLGVGACVSAVPAFAETPVWSISSALAPRNIAPGGKGKLIVTAVNLGDAAADGGASRIVVSDTLPAGLRATAVSGASEGGGIENGVKNDGPLACPTPPVTISPIECVFEKSVRPYETLTVTVEVEAGAPASGLSNDVSVAGGEATSVSGSGPVTISSTPASFGVEKLELTPTNEDGTPDTQAGSHPYQLTTTFDLNRTLTPEGSVPVNLPKDLHFNLPPGLIGNPQVTPECTDKQFSSHNGFANICPAETVVGVSSVTVILDRQEDDLTVPLYNLVPSVGEPARFGFLVAGTPVILDTSLRTGGDYGVVVSINNISEVLGFTGSQTTFWGAPGDPSHDKSRGWGCVGSFTSGAFNGEPCPFPSVSGGAQAPPFLTLPTSCTGPLQTVVEADSWAKPGSFKLGEYTFQDREGNLLGLDGCNRLDFEPSISVAPDGRAASTPTGLTVGVHVPQTATLNPVGLAEADVKDTTVTLPEGVALNPAAADGLEACSIEQAGFKSIDPQTGTALFTPAPVTCPEASKIATVEINSPLLPNPLTGAVYLAAQNANPFGSLVAMYLVAEDPISGVHIKLAGEGKLSETGQIVTTFANTPQLPFEDLHLKFFGTARAPLSSPALCGTYTTTASISPWSGNAPASAASSFEVNTGPNGGPCASPLPFAPSLTAGTTSNQAGGFSPFTMTMSREDGQQNLRGVQLHMPPGLSGLLSSVALCGEAQANAGTCGPESQIGETIISVGLGGDPFSVKGGRVYITGPYEGAPFGLSIVNPAKAGPYDLGKGACDCVVVRARIEVDPHTADLTITTDNTGPYKIPTILDGIPLEIKHVNVTINRPGFTFNPTSCSPLALTGSLASTEGTASNFAVPFQVTNCAALAFKPALKVTTAGKTSRAGGASLNVKLVYPKAPFGSQANIKSVKVDLPKQLPSRLTTLQKACTAATFEANPANCPTASVVGHATATTPLLPVPLTGPAYFVSHGGEAFPSLIVVLQGYGVTLDLIGSTFISKQGITSSTFKTVPDAPVGSFELNLPEGKYSALAANGNLCKSKLAMPTAFTAQNGAEIHASTKIATTGCPKNKKATKKKGSGKAGGKGKKSKKKG
jgi:hypothetical protein